MRSTGVVLGLSLALAQVATAQEGRFDVQGFRPLGAPQDLVMVAQSRPLEKWSFVLGGYLSYQLDPLNLVRQESGQKTLSIVGGRWEVDVMAAVGLFGWMEIGAVMPIIASQSSDNLAAVGTEGAIQGQSLGDLRLVSKIAIPYLKRKPEAAGFGMALTLGMTFPTGNVDAFTSDGTYNFQGGLVADYRFKSGLLLAANAGFWTRPKREWNGLLVGDTFPVGLAAEIPVVRRWGLTVIGEAYSNISLYTLANQPRQAPLSGLVGVRWYSSYGVTFTVGVGGGCDCSFGAPSVSGFLSAIWVPGATKEKEALEHFKQPPPPDPDPDKDEVIGTKDKCPDLPGPVENHGCPDTDKDKDGIIDRLDKCPTESGVGDPDGCPEFHIVDDKIVLREQIYFYTDSDMVKPESLPLLDRLTKFVAAHSEIDQIRVDGHTDLRANADYNQKLSERRARAVVKHLTARGVKAERLKAKGYGSSQPLVKLEEVCEGYDPDDRKSKNAALTMMSDQCIQASAVNRRIEFTIEHTYEYKMHTVLPSNSLPTASPLPAAGLPSTGLPAATGLPKSGLPKSGLPSAGLPKASGLPSNGLPTTIEATQPPHK